MRVPEHALFFLIGAAAARYLEHDQPSKEKRAELRAASEALLAQFSEAVSEDVHVDRESVLPEAGEPGSDVLLGTPETFPEPFTIGESGVKLADPLIVERND
jgi:hypothetical protein